MRQRPDSKPKDTVKIVPVGGPKPKPKFKRKEGFQEKVLRHLDHIERQLKTLMTDVTEVTASLEVLKTDLEAKAAEAKAEFVKLEEELAAATAGGEPPNLTPLKEAIDGIDASVKSAVVPST